MKLRNLSILVFERFLYNSTISQCLKIVAFYIIMSSIIIAPRARADETLTADRVSDFNWLVSQIRNNYVYLPDSGVDLNRARLYFLPDVEAAVTSEAWLHVLERFVNELHDNHATLGTNSSSSPQLVPSGTDLWAELRGGQAIITEVRSDSSAQKQGLQAGNVIAAINDVPLLEAVSAALPEGLTLKKAGDFTLRALLAGTHDRVRSITLANHTRIVLPPYVQPARGPSVVSEWINPDVGYIRFQNSLGDEDTVAAFDEASTRFRNAKGLILDLRDTPSGGNTDVAEPILGRFITKEGSYQRIGDDYKNSVYDTRSVLRGVDPRGPFTLSMPLVLLVDHWTGSMGEGLAVGLKALIGAKVVGTRMAGLRGGTEAFTLPRTKITVDFPTYRIYQVDGVPREEFVPDVVVKMGPRDGSADPILSAGVGQLRSLLHAPIK